MTILYHKEFIKRFKKQPIKIKDKFKQRLVLFMQDEFDPALNNHALKGKYEGYRSINITGDVGVIFKKRARDVNFITVDSHSNLYS